MQHIAKILIPLSKQIYTNFRNGTIRRVSASTFRKMLIESLIEESFNSIANGLLDAIDTRLETIWWEELRT